MCSSGVATLVHSRCACVCRYKCHHLVPNVAFCVGASGATVPPTGAALEAPAPPQLSASERAAGVRQRATMENAAAVLLGTSAADCPTPTALGSVCDGLPTEAAVQAVMLRLGEHDTSFLERTCEALARCRAAVIEHVLHDGDSVRSGDARGSRLQTVCDLLQDVARAGNMCVARVCAHESRRARAPVGQAGTADCLCTCVSAVQAGMSSMCSATSGATARARSCRCSLA